MAKSESVEDRMRFIYILLALMILIGTWIAAAA